MVARDSCTAMGKLLCHAILVLGEGCNTLLTSATTTTPPKHTVSTLYLPCLELNLVTGVLGTRLPWILHSSVFGHIYIYALPAWGLLCTCICLANNAKSYRCNVWLMYEYISLAHDEGPSSQIGVSKARYRAASVLCTRWCLSNILLWGFKLKKGF